MASCIYKNSIIVLNMENGIEVSSMFLGRPWLKQIKAHHNWGDNTFTIISKWIIVKVSTNKHVNVKSYLQPKNLDNEYDWEEQLLEQEKQILYNAVPKLWHVGEVALKVKINWLWHVTTITKNWLSYIYLWASTKKNLTLKVNWKKTTICNYIIVAKDIC